MTRRFLQSVLPVAIAVAALSIRAEDPSPVELGDGVGNFLAKLETEKTAHVAFLGGSITQKQSGHVQKVSDWLMENWSDVDFTFTNAGLSSTCSQTGAFRLREDILSKGPVDLLIVEFAVNDDQDAGHSREQAIRGLEGIVRQYFQANPTGSVISVQFVNPELLEKALAGETGTSVAAHKDVARHYGIPSVDVGQALAAEITAGRKTWKEDYGGTHPNDAGYGFATRLITRVIEESPRPQSALAEPLPEPLDDASYSGARTVDPQELAWLGGWKFAEVSRDLLPLGAIREDYTTRKAIRSDEGGNFLYGAFAGRMLGAFVLAGPDAGALEVSIDGGEWKRVDLYHRYSKGLNYPRSVILASGLREGYHTVAIRTAEESHPESQGHSATILQFQVNQ